MQKLEQPILAVDVVIFSAQNKKLSVLLHERKSNPFAGATALPGVAVRLDETLISAAQRALIEKSGFSSETCRRTYLEQLATFDALYRDIRGRTVSVAYMGIAPPPKTDDENQGTNGSWLSVENMQKGSLPFDHEEIILTARARLQGKLRYTNIAHAFLNERFRIEKLQETYEAILGVKLNRTNFRNKLLKIGLIEQVTVLSEAVGKKGGRPPHLYRFTSKNLEIISRDFLYV